MGMKNLKIDGVKYKVEHFNHATNWNNPGPHIDKLKPAMIQWIWDRPHDKFNKYLRLDVENICYDLGLTNVRFIFTPQ